MMTKKEFIYQLEVCFDKVIIKDNIIIVDDIYRIKITDDWIYLYKKEETNFRLLFQSDNYMDIEDFLYMYMDVFHPTIQLAVVERKLFDNSITIEWEKLTKQYVKKTEYCSENEFDFNIGINIEKLTEVEFFKLLRQSKANGYISDKQFNFLSKNIICQIREQNKIIEQEILYKNISRQIIKQNFINDSVKNYDKFSKYQSLYKH